MPVATALNMLPRLRSITVVPEILLRLTITSPIIELAVTQMKSPWALLLKYTVVPVVLGGMLSSV